MRINLLVVISTPTYGGPHNQVLRLNEQLLQSGVRQIVIVPDDSVDSYDRLVEKGIEVHKYPIRRVRRLGKFANNLSFIFNYKSGSKMFRSIIKKFDIDIVQVCGLLNFQAAIVANQSNTPVVWQLLSSNFVPKPLRNALCYIVTKYSTVTMHVGIGTLLKHPFNKKFKNKINFHPPVNTDNFQLNAINGKKVKETLGIPSDAIVIGTVGNRVKPKSHERIVGLVDSIVSSYPNVYFVICGKKDKSHEGYYHQEVVTKIDALFNVENLKLIEWDGDVNEMLNAFDVFLSLSHTEGMPTVILEAMSSSLPIISTDVGSVREILDDGINGRIISNYDHNEAFDSLQELIESPQQRMKMGAINRENALEKFSTEKCVQKHLEAFKLAQNMKTV